MIVRELNVRPVEGSLDTFSWRTDDGTTYDTDGLSAYALSLLNDQMLADDPTGTAESNLPRRRD